jgi:hypothetical protein
MCCNEDGFVDDGIRDYHGNYDEEDDRADLKEGIDLVSFVGQNPGMNRCHHLEVGGLHEAGEMFGRTF